MHPPNLAALLVLVAAALAAAALSSVLVRRMIGLAVMDVPGARSAHDRPTPRGGGVGMVAAVLLGVPACLVLLPGGPGRLLPAALLLGATALLAAVSWLDDLRQFGVRAKLGAQCAASALTVAASLASAPVWPAFWLLAPLCLLGFCWLMLTTNALKFIDGLNGLASGVAAICGVFACLLGLALGDPLLAACGAMLSAGLLGFLPYNMPRARIFMGDVGSQVCGLLTGGFALLLLADTARLAVAEAILLILAGILWDVLFTLARRLRAGERITQAHRGHLYQVAARSGLSHGKVAVIHWAFALWGGAISLALLPARPVIAAMIVLLPQLSWSATVWLRARRAGLSRWS